MGEKRSTCRLLVGKPEGERPVVWTGLVWLRIGKDGELLGLR
jgi:hypothetical protein